ncbi:GntR family transcriptional regulator [Breznakiella homolactica]|uniref:GntR family transcriptional regulator n=1 Tax=Breznakiella homolactica TaxID=2798577 RepID=A0A7T7XLQ5_9SPIR|nr:GntR family transcriptional regulator [Breznakiella homolactica]QQO08620.1 GntR family transcriptional regulator [Breznakiella homolactica]
MKEQKLSEQAYEKIKQLIKNRKYLPGEALPENELSVVLNMSRTPIREALHRLEDEQVVTIKPHLGTFVATVDFGELCNIYETREAVEGMIANILCKPHIDTAPFEDLREELLQIKDISDDAERAEKLHKFGSRYVSKLRTLCGNSMLEKLSASISVRIDSMGLITRTIPLFPDASVPERLAVLEAIIAKDSQRAEQEARQHVRNVFSRIMAARMPNSKL